MIGRLRNRRVVRGALLATLLGMSALAVCTGWAASLTVTSNKLTTWTSPAGCTPGTTTVSAEADSYVDQDSPSSNYGNATDLKVRAPLLGIGGIDLGGVRQTLVRFTLPDAGLCSVTLAKLRLYTSTAAAGRTLEALRLNGSWAEGTVTWSNKPATTGTAVTTTSGAGYREWTVTSQVTAMYAGANNGFVVRDTSGVALLAPENIFNSRTAASNRPELVVTLG